VSGRDTGTDQGEEEMLETSAPAGAAKSAEGEVRTLSARHLFGAGRVLRIEHDGEIYTLRLTRNNKLILTK
jgi:hemin uptake protein HemP